MKESKNLICIGCPLGCSVQVDFEDGEIVKVSGNTCARGDAYARQELTAPVRMVTTTVRVRGGGMLPVKTRENVPKSKVREVIAALRDTEAVPPVSLGDIILGDAAGTGVPVVAAKSIRSDT